MKTIFPILKTEFAGIINLSWPILLMAYLSPEFLLDPWGRLLCALIIGAYVFFINRAQSKKVMAQLKFAPSGEHKQMIKQYITASNLDPQQIQIRYAYTNEMIATSTFNTISLDPLMWNLFENDPENNKAKETINVHILPKLTPEVVQRINQIREIFSPGAQRFILRHELGHTFYSYSYKHLLCMGLVASAFTYAGISIAIALYPFISSAAILVGIICSGLIDIFLSYAVNRFFRFHAEQQADLFAVRLSKTEDILAAADFFEKHASILEAAWPKDGLLMYIPSKWRLGYCDGRTRAAYLRAHIQ